jgi:cobalt/nickel transport system ATP-binding protein
VSFSLREGERAALVGANGAGKSTLLLALAGIVQSAGGSVSVKGSVMKKETLKEIRRLCALLMQNPDDQLFMPTVAGDLAFGPRNYGLPEKDISVRMDSLLDKLGIGPLRERLTSHLSGGEKRIAALAGVLMMEPELLLMDEPSSFLDPRMRRRLIGILKERNETMLVATHDLDLALQLCPRTLILCDGTLCADGDSAALLGDHALLDRCGL